MRFSRIFRINQRHPRCGLTKETLMRKNPASESGLFNPRVLIAFSLCSVGALLAMFSFAATPPSGTLTTTSGPISYTTGQFFVANPTPVIEVDSGPECDNPLQPCDDYALTVTLPSGYAATHPNAAINARRTRYTLSPYLPCLHQH